MEHLYVIVSIQNTLLGDINGYEENHRILIENPLFLSAESSLWQLDDNLLYDSIEKVSFRTFDDLK